MELFDFTKVLFGNPKEYAKLKTVEKGKHFFMLQRFFSIKFPATAQQLNRQRVGQRFGRVPGWIYTKTKKVASEKVWKPNPEVATIWMQRHGLGERDLQLAIKFNPEEMKKYFQKLEKQIEVYDR